MYGVLLSFHILVCIALVASVLLQSGKGGGLAGGAFGGTAQTVFGGRGATDFMTRATMVLGGVFFATSLVLALMSSNTDRATRSLIQEDARRSGAAAPRVPGASTAPPNRLQQAPLGKDATPTVPAPATPTKPALATPTGGGK